MGSIPEVQNYPWSALLFYGDRDSSAPKCNGALINNRFVLTAAHCLIEGTQKKNLTFVRLGEYDLDENPEKIYDMIVNLTRCYSSQMDIEPGETIIHPEYQPNSTNRHHDIALVKLKYTIRYTSAIRSIHLPYLSFEITAERDFIVSGWGVTYRFEKQGYPEILSPIKLVEELPLFDWKSCQDVYISNFTLGSGQLCAGGELNKDTCQGDSGSALATQVTHNERKYWVLVGLVSFGPKKCGTEGKPGIYTNVKEYVEWIIKHVEDLPTNEDGEDDGPATYPYKGLS